MQAGCLPNPTAGGRLSITITSRPTPMEAPVGNVDVPRNAALSLANGHARMRIDEVFEGVSNPIVYTSIKPLTPHGPASRPSVGELVASRISRVVSRVSRAGRRPSDCEDRRAFSSLFRGFRRAGRAGARSRGGV